MTDTSLPAWDADGMDIAESILDLIGNTPMVRMKRVSEEHGIRCTLAMKHEVTNPGGSSKDRPALEMILAAEASGELQPGGTIVEPTSGNTGVGLAIVAAQRGYKCVFVMTNKAGKEKVDLLRAYGAEVVVCDVAVAPEDPNSYYSVAERLTQERGAFRPNQYANPHNPAAHTKTTGPEIWEQTKGRITHFIAGAGTCGSLTGTGRYLSRRIPTSRSSPLTPKSRCFPGVRDAHISSKASAKISSRPPTTAICGTRSSRSATKRASSWPATSARPKASLSEAQAALPWPRH